MFCGWLFCEEGAIPHREAAIEAIMSASRPDGMLPRLRRVYPEKAGIFDGKSMLSLETWRSIHPQKRAAQQPGPET